MAEAMVDDPSEIFRALEALRHAESAADGDVVGVVEPLIASFGARYGIRFDTTALDVGWKAGEDIVVYVQDVAPVAEAISCARVLAMFYGGLSDEFFVSVELFFYLEGVRVAPPSMELLGFSLERNDDGAFEWTKRGWCFGEMDENDKFLKW